MYIILLWRFDMCLECTGECKAFGYTLHYHKPFKCYNSKPFNVEKQEAFVLCIVPVFLNTYIRV